MKRIITLIMLLLACQMLSASGRDSLSVRRKALKDTLEFSSEFLDTVTIRSSKSINDYSLIGVNYGVTFSNTSFNPRKHERAFVVKPNYVSVTYTHFSKLFDMLPICAIVVGAEYGTEGYTFQQYEDGSFSNNVDGATYCSMKVLEIPAMAQFHFDFEPIKFMVDLGVYGGYRQSIERSGRDLDPEFRNSFRSYENRFDYGLQGGGGFGIILSPIEIHFNCHVRWAWSSLYQPDYYNPQWHPDNTVYYRYAYPLDIIATVGIHFQLTKRTGKTTAQLKREAKSIVYGTN